MKKTANRAAAAVGYAVVTALVLHIGHIGLVAWRNRR